MSCTDCNDNLTGTANPFSCPCDQFIHPLPLDIGAGLDELPRQLAGFPEFRRAMLYRLRQEEVSWIDPNNNWVTGRPLANWRARGDDDLGIMLLEMWAYLCDSLAFYDQVIANEAYLRTSRLKPDIRRLTALLGYLPRPAVGSTVYLAALAEGRLPVQVPAGTSFRSGAFDGNPSQVFHTDTDLVIHPLLNKWKLKPAYPSKIQQLHPNKLTVLPVRNIKEGDLLLLTHQLNSYYNQGLSVQSVEKLKGIDQVTYGKLGFAANTRLSTASWLKHLELWYPTRSADLWTLNSQSDSIVDNTIVLDHKSSLFNAGDLILLQYQQDIRWYRIIQVQDVSRSATAASTLTINGNSFSMPGMTVAVTKLTLDTNVNSSSRKQSGTTNWGGTQVNRIKLFYGMTTAARVAELPRSGITPNDDLLIDGEPEWPVEDTMPTAFLLKDKNTRGVLIDGEVDQSVPEISLSQGENWDPALVSPVQAYGNVLTAFRGERVDNEILGNGDASLANQTFKLKKKPLTYYLSPTAENDTAVKSTLSLYVNGVKWTEVRSFFCRTELEQIYIVRQDDNGDTFITGGDGKRGERFPTGTSNIVAYYHFGAEAACPPAGVVNQIAKPVKGFQSVKNTTAAFGGADAEPLEEIRKYAPPSALLLGRVVSMADMEAATMTFPGVEAVQAEWRWSGQRQAAVAVISYIGDAALQSPISQQLHNLSDPTVPIQVENATAIPVALSIIIRIDSRYLEKDVIAALRTDLLNDEDGILIPGYNGIGQPLFRSRLYEAIMATAGVLAVDGIFLNGMVFDSYASNPGSRHYYDFLPDQLLINGQ
ncbi:MAG TPA: hypothetical protein VKA08_08425 [Balneolales bacterium]|nr:hypothetical protein [Balneolales bacterium]